MMKHPTGISILLYVLGHGWDDEISQEPFNAPPQGLSGITIHLLHQAKPIFLKRPIMLVESITPLNGKSKIQNIDGAELC